MALLDPIAGLIVTAAPGTGSTALRAAFLARPGVRELEPVSGVDPKHGTVAQQVAAGALAPDHGLTVVTSTRNPFDFYVAEWERSRTRWVHELRRPSSWVYRTPGALDGLVDALTLDFEPWLAQVIGDPGRSRRINAGHVDEADVVLRMESVEADLRDRLGLDLAVPATNTTDRDRAYWRAYGVASRELVERAHAADLERFGYRF